MDREGYKPEHIPLATVRRLASYFNCLQRLRERGIQQVSSQQLAERIGIKPSQLRHDLYYFGEFGQPGYGYDVALLEGELAKILNVEPGQNMIIVGAGNLGQAIATYRNFETRGFCVKGLFDINPRLVGLAIGGVQVRDIDEIPEVVAKEKVSIGVITVPAEGAQATADLLIQAGIQGIWNFAPVELQVPEGIPVQNEHLSVGLLTLSYLIKRRPARVPCTSKS